MVSASRSSTVSLARTSLASSLPSLFTINRPRILEYRLDYFPCTIMQTLKKASMPAGVTGDAAPLHHHEKDGVVIAIKANFPHVLRMTRSLALAPQRVTRTRPIVRKSARGRLREGLAVHPRQSQNDATVGLLSDGRHQPVGIPFDLIQPA